MKIIKSKSTLEFSKLDMHGGIIEFYALHGRDPIAICVSPEDYWNIVEYRNIPVIHLADVPSGTIWFDVAIEE